VDSALAARGRVDSAEEPLERVWDRLRAKLGEPSVIVTVPQGRHRI
jgi:hypothetical protein